MTKAVILAGGLGTRLSEHTQTRPKPMVEIGGRPILWHIMKIYDAHGITDFVICLGYKGYMIKEYFHNYMFHMSDVSIDISTGTTQVHSDHSEHWNVTLINTGEHAMTGARIRRIIPYVADCPYFCLTYGDGVGDIDITNLIDYHTSHNRLATLTAVTPPGRFGVLKLRDMDNRGGVVTEFFEKPDGDGGLINGGFFVLSPKVIDFIPDGDGVSWEQEPLRRLAEAKQLAAYRHHGFWQPMDTLRDQKYLEDKWLTNNPPWKVWN